jgi:glycosyltransferase involved in cell wall biosynthesis
MITVALPWTREELLGQMIEPYAGSHLIGEILIMAETEGLTLPGGMVRSQVRVMATDALLSGMTIRRIIEETRSKYLLWVQPAGNGRPVPGALERFVEVAESSGAPMVYGDYVGHPVNDYQVGSIRDTFDFGPLLFFNIPVLRRCLRKYGNIPNVRHAGLYDLRLKASAAGELFHLPECLSAPVVGGIDTPFPVDGHFAYVDSRHRPYQVEMERVATDHLKRLRAYLGPVFRNPPPCREAFPVTASVIIPVRNRVRTIAEAVESALGQRTDFPFNIIAVDNHSSDGTTEILDGLVKRHDRVKHVIPGRTDLGIGGCWNEAIGSPFCGRYVVQLDSDDLYGHPDVLERIVDAFSHDGGTAMVIGSYTIVNEHLEEIPPGLIDHREWTDDNGRNNALRINGLGAPRAFRTDLIRQIGFPNVSYGEDYAVALRLSREYRTGRIYDSLYFCRRWAGNTDAALSVDTANRFDAYKDKLRTLEILARRKMNRTRKISPPFEKGGLGRI